LQGFMGSITHESTLTISCSRLSGGTKAAIAAQVLGIAIVQPGSVSRLDLNTLLVAPEFLHALAVAQRLGIPPQVVLGFGEELAVLVFGVVEHGENMTWGRCPSDTVADAQYCRLNIVFLVEMGDAGHRDVQLFGHILEWRQNPAHVAC